MLGVHRQYYGCARAWGAPDREVLMSRQGHSFMDSYPLDDARVSDDLRARIQVEDQLLR